MAAKAEDRGFKPGLTSLTSFKLPTCKIALKLSNLIWPRLGNRYGQALLY